MQKGNDALAKHDPDFFAELSQEIKVISYLIQAVGDSTSLGVPSEPELLEQTLARLSWRLDSIAETIETVAMDLETKES